MTAVNVVCSARHNAVYLATDAAAYTPAGVLVGVGSKVFTEPGWPGVIAGRGSAIAVPLLGAALSMSFGSFDHLVDGIENVLEGMVEHYGIQGSAELIIAGISAERGPEAYVIETSDTGPVGISRDDAKASGFVPDAYVLQRLSEIVNGPVPQQDVVDDARFVGFTADDEPFSIIAGLTTLLEMQRHSLFDDGICWVGGYGQLVTVGADGVHHKILQRWDDQIGEMMKPAPPDWSTFRPSAQVIPTGLSRLQRERMEKKARKSTLRAVP